MICPECGAEFEKHVYNQKYCKEKCYLSHKKRTQARNRRKDPKKLAIDVARNKKRFDKRRGLGLCPACGDVPEAGVHCESCKLRIKGYNSINRSNKCY